MYKARSGFPGEVIMRNFKVRLTVFLIIPVVLTGCTGMRYRSYRHEQPSEYYLYLPEDPNTDKNWPVFIGVHGEDQVGLDCFETWEGFAEDFGFVLLCPTFKMQEGEIQSFEGERTLADILTQLYGTYDLEDRFFMAGFSNGASFAVHYGYRYPQALTGVAAIASPVYPEPVVQAQELPLLLVVGEQDDQALGPTNDFHERLQQMGFPSRLIVLQGVDHRMTSDARRLVIELFRQVSR
jgi:predicted peptidase